jgi:hypothetical protein
VAQVKGQLMNAHSLPSAQQMRALTQGQEDVTRIVSDTNALIAAIPALFDRLGAGALKPAPLKPVRAVNATN